MLLSQFISVDYYLRIIIVAQICCCLAAFLLKVQHEIIWILWLFNCWIKAFIYCRMHFINL